MEWWTHAILKELRTWEGRKGGQKEGGGREEEVEETWMGEGRTGGEEKSI
jgi:hypothetical protein